MYFDIFRQIHNFLGTACFYLYVFIKELKLTNELIVKVFFCVEMGLRKIGTRGKTFVKIFMKSINNNAGI